MTEVARSMTVKVNGRGEGRGEGGSDGPGAGPGRVAYLTLGWALVQGAFAAGCALAGTPLFRRGDNPAPAGLDWLVAAAAVLAVLAATGAVRWGDRRSVRVLLRVSCVLAMLSAFSLLMDVLMLLLDGGVDSVPSTVHHTLGMVGAVLLAATLHGLRTRGGTLCARCGGAAHETAVLPEPSVAPRRVRLAAYAGTAAFVPYAAMKLAWASGGTFAGVTGAEMIEKSKENGASGLWLTLEGWGLDPTALLAALGVFLLFGLVRPWGQVFPRWTLLLAGRRVPRWLPLTPALIGAGTLAPYGVAGVCGAALGTAGVLHVPKGDFPSPADVLLVSWIGLGAFAVYGVALALAARSYWVRTRARCAENLA
ncbi:hypothetical protein [Streptomyces cinnamoneus]|nr:hypothetical protein [Streptomyces cinnamoneus]